MYEISGKINEKQLTEIGQMCAAYEIEDIRYIPEAALPHWRVTPGSGNPFNIFPSGVVKKHNA